MINDCIIKEIIESMRSGFEKDTDHFSATRDVFTARLEMINYEYKNN
jgi:hypothetical protein